METTYQQRRDAEKRESKKARIRKTEDLWANLIATFVLTIGSPLDLLLGRRQCLRDEMLRQENDDRRRTAAEEATRQHRAWCLVTGLILLVSIIDMIIILPNLTGTVAKQIARSENPGFFAIMLASLIFEAVILGLLVVFKILGDTSAAQKDRIAAISQRDYNRACLRWVGAWFARLVFVLIISAAFFMNFRAEQMMANSDKDLADGFKEITNSGLIEDSTNPETPESGGALAFSTQSGITVALWTLHLAILVMPRGVRRIKHVAALSYAELAVAHDRIERRIGRMTGRLVSRMLLARHNENSRRAVYSVLSERVIGTLPFRDKSGVVDIDVTIVDVEPTSWPRENGNHHRRTVAVEVDPPTRE